MLRLASPPPSTAEPGHPGPGESGGMQAAGCSLVPRSDGGGEGRRFPARLPTGKNRFLLAAHRFVVPLVAFAYSGSGQTPPLPIATTPRVEATLASAASAVTSPRTAGACVEPPLVAPGGPTAAVSQHRPSASPQRLLWRPLREVGCPCYGGDTPVTGSLRLPPACVKFCLAHVGFDSNVGCSPLGLPLVDDLGSGRT